MPGLSPRPTCSTAGAPVALRRVRGDRSGRGTDCQPVPQGLPLTPDCPFCRVAPERAFLVTDDVIGLWDAFPVSPGHALLVPKRHVATWFDATAAERAALAEATELARREIVKLHDPPGFNIGVNAGAAAGQTIFHLHVHVIPRYVNDVRHPRGGVRGVIPSKRDYGPPDGKARKLVQGGDDDPLLPELERELAQASSADIAVAFTLTRGVELLFPHLQDFLERDGVLRFLSGDYRDATEPEALVRLMDLQGRAELRIFETNTDRPSERPLFPRAFHPKSYIFRRDDDAGVAFVGSSNVSESALRFGIEWNYRVTSSDDVAGFGAIRTAFDRVFSHPATRPLTLEWIDRYAKRRAITLQTRASAAEEVVSEPALVREPHEVQREALAALEETRSAENTAGLVVLATGLGKTWLSAFDTDRPEFKRVLFVAHREEILNQALHTFRQIRPNARLGLYNGSARQPESEVLFASIQTLSRRAHLERFSSDEFDYIVVDEFHHAAATSYRRLIDYFRPKFLLGLTATPERTDGGNLLALCQENLVYRCDLRDGIRRGLLAPFHYFGVPDDVDYANIPWRSSRFDEEALTAAVATQRRAGNALEQWRKRGGRRTIAFCVSRRHAEFMSDFFQTRGLRSVAVHSGAGSAPRALSLEQLSAGELDIVCAVDMFNEGVDVPALDTVMMLRPTESRILWLQQFGRGLRKADGKPHLNVIDYIGNHKTFLLKPQTLFDLGAGRQEVLAFLDRYRDDELDLPPGCEVTYDLEAVEILRDLVQPVRGDVAAIRRYYEDFRDLHGARPKASEAYHDGYNPRAARPDHGSWLGLARSMGDLDSAARTVLDRHGDFFATLDTTEMVKSYKMVVLLAMLNADALPGSISIDGLVDGVSTAVSRSATLRDEFGEAAEDRSAMRRLLETNPIKAWTGGKGTGGTSYFDYAGGSFRLTLDVETGIRTAFQELLRELVEWRLAEYLDRSRRTAVGQMVCKVSQSEGRPILFLPPRDRNPQIPSGTTPVMIGSDQYLLDFVKIAVNVARRTPDGDNELPRLLRSWFGPDAGMPGTRHTVVLENLDGEWHLRPEGQQQGAVQLWKAYSREQIPALFAMQFSTAIWNVGYVARSGHMFLLVTLDKAGHSKDFQYGDRFLEPRIFEWQSQNRTSQAGSDGQLIKNHVERGTPVHLFVRATKKNGSRSAPFVYCGDVTFSDWEGDRPVTVRWILPEPVPERLWETLRVPPPTSRPFRVVRPTAAERYKSAVPLVTLRVAAGTFGDEQLDLESLADAAEEWITWDRPRPFEPGMFVAQVKGRSMEPEIADGSYVLFRPVPAGSRQGRRLLIRHRGIEDAETGGQFTVKVYSSEKTFEDDGTLRHVSITLKPVNPEYQPIVLTAEDEGDVRAIGEVVEVLRG